MTKTKFDCKVKSVKKIETSSTKEDTEEGIIVLESLKGTITIKGDVGLLESYKPNQAITLTLENPQTTLKETAKPKVFT